MTIQRQRRQGEAARAIEKAGGKVLSKPTWLGILLRDDSLVEVNDVEFLGRPITDADLVRLQELHQLKVLASTTQMSPTPAWCISEGLSQLEWLWFHNVNITDAGLAHLEGLSKLERLALKAPMSRAPAWSI